MDKHHPSCHNNQNQSDIFSWIFCFFHHNTIHTQYTHNNSNSHPSPWATAVDVRVFILVMFYCRKLHYVRWQRQTHTPTHTQQYIPIFLLAFVSCLLKLCIKMPWHGSLLLLSLIFIDNIISSKNKNKYKQKKIQKIMKFFFIERMMSMCPVQSAGYFSLFFANRLKS